MEIMRRISRIPVTANSIIASLFVAIVLSACNFEANNMQQYRHIPSTGWYADSLLLIPVPVSDTIGEYEVSIGLRYTDEYRYRNLWLFATLVAPDGTQTIDTLNCRLADEYGRWYGSGIGATMQQREMYKESLRFPHSGTWHIAIQQGMREECLQGITDVGVKVSRR